MALEGPQIHFVRTEDRDGRLAEALELARRLDELLEEAHSVPPPSRQGPGASASASASTRMARAMAAGLVDELEALVRGSRNKTSVG